MFENQNPDLTRAAVFGLHETHHKNICVCRADKQQFVCAEMTDNEPKLYNKRSVWVFVGNNLAKHFETKRNELKKSEFRISKNVTYSIRQ